MRNNFLQLLLILLPFTSFAQVSPATYYLDKDLNLCSKSKSFYSGEGKWEGGNYRLDLYPLIINAVKRVDRNYNPE